MYKFQKIYFSKPNIPDEVIKKSLMKVNIKEKQKKKIKKISRVKEKTKSTRQQETEKLIKKYARNNNMISLLILLLKRKDETKRQYKTKSSYRSGYKKSQNYQTRTSINKERTTDQRKAEGKKTFTNVSSLLNEAQNEARLGNSKKEQELLKKALKISENYLTEQDYETYGKFLTLEEKKNPELISRMKKSAEEAIIQAEGKRKIELKSKQNEGREQKRLLKEQEIQNYIDSLTITTTLNTSEVNKIFDDFKSSSLKEPITSYSKSAFTKILKQKKNDRTPKEKKKDESKPIKKTLLNEFLEKDTYNNNINGIDEQIKFLKKIAKGEEIKITKLKNKSNKTEEEEKQLQDTEIQFMEVEDHKELLKQKKALLKQYIDDGIIPDDVKEKYLPDTTDPTITNDIYEGELLYLSQKLGEESSSDEDDDLQKQLEQGYYL